MHTIELGDSVENWLASLSPLALSNPRTVDFLTDYRASLSHYLPLSVIGKGSFGKVLLVRKCDDQRMFAMKILNKQHVVQKMQIARARAERRILQMVRKAPFCIELLAAFQDMSNLYLVLEFCPGGDLFFHLSRRRLMTETASIFYAAEVLSAIHALHALHIVYRDLKPENILLTAKGHVRLTDFGLAKMGITSPIKGAHSVCGTAEYMAPEILNQQRHGTAVDIWSFGMVFHEMLTGFPPWYTTDRNLLCSRIRFAKLRLTHDISPHAKEVIEATLDRNPARRPSAKAVSAFELFGAIDFDQLSSMQPPLTPNINDEDPTANFERTFVNMAISLSRENPLLPKGATFSDYDFRAPHHQVAAGAPEHCSTAWQARCVSPS